MPARNKTVSDVERMFNARTIAIAGASNDLNKFGGMTLHTLMEGGYEGSLYPVNPKATEVQGLKAYPSIANIPGTLDLVLVVIPAKFVPGVLKQAAAKGACGAAILSAGFSEAGRFDLEDEILAVSKECGIRLMGPNIQGINYLPNKLCAMFFPVIKTRGPLAIVSQSGSVTAALSEWADRDGMGISAAINLGNQTDICESDYLDFFVEDRNTHTIVMYLEGLKDGRRFLGALEKAAYLKPVVILKSGRSETGAKSAASHTGSMAGNHEIFSAACRQYGAVSVQDLVALYDSAKGLACIAPPKGNRIMIISTSGGAATLSVDEAESLGLIIPSLSAELKASLERLGLSPLAHISNPLDLAGIAANHFLGSARMVDRYNIADSILINFADPVAGAVEVIRTLASELKASLAVSYMGGGEEEKKGSLEIQRMGLGVFPSPERAVRGIAAVTWRAQYQRKRSAIEEKKDA